MNDEEFMERGRVSRIVEFDDPDAFDWIRRCIESMNDSRFNLLFNSVLALSEMDRFRCLFCSIKANNLYVLTKMVPTVDCKKIPSFGGYTALMYAAVLGRRAAVDVLIPYSDISQFINLGTAEDLARDYGNQDLANHLKDYSDAISQKAQIERSLAREMRSRELEDTDPGSEEISSSSRRL